MTRHESASNRAKAPITGAFVEAVRAFDPQAKVLFVSEGDLTLGKRADYSGYYRVHSGQCGSVSELIARQAKQK